MTKLPLIQRKLTTTPRSWPLFSRVSDMAADKPLLYYAARLARNQGYQILNVSYGSLPENVKGDRAKMEQAFELALKHTEQFLQNVDWHSYGSILFISKSLGTIISSAYASRHDLTVKSILFTPLADTFSFSLAGSIAFHGTADPWAETEIIQKLAQQKEVPLFSYKKRQPFTGNRRCADGYYDSENYNGAG